ncbi:ZCHC3 protein, partial [Polyodon spathula]|nr:ZCHC3 protein [Polyodon spathula]
NPHVTDEEVKIFVGSVCDIFSGPEKVCDPMGIWNGKRRFFVRLRITSAEAGGIVHLPGIVQIGGNRGYLSYPGQPRNCYKCGEGGHEAAKCSALFCRKCQSAGHEAKDCEEPKKCSKCGGLDHLYKDC